MDDDALVRETLRCVLAGAGYEVAEARSGAEGLELVAASRFDLVTLDVAMPGPSLPDVIRGVARLYPGTRIVVISAYVDPGDDSWREGVSKVIVKPFGVKELLHTVATVLS